MIHIRLMMFLVSRGGKMKKKKKRKETGTGAGCNALQDAHVQSSIERMHSLGCKDVTHCLCLIGISSLR